MKSHVYLLSHRNGKRFKIGKANDILLRARCFGLGEIDWADSAGIEVQNTAAAYNLERILLRTFAASLLSAEHVIEDQGTSDGATEWFYIDCRPRVEVFLLHIQDIFPHRRICGQTLSHQVDSLLQPRLQAAARREILKREKQLRNTERETLRRAQADATRAILQSALTKAHDNLWRELERHATKGTIVGMALQEYGWNLILLDEEGEDLVWQTELLATNFVWPGGGGGLVDSIVQRSCCDARVCIVRLGSCLYDSWLSREVTKTILGHVTGFLRSLLSVECSQLKSVLWDTFYDDDDWREQENELVIQAFVDTYRPILQTRQAAKKSEFLF